MRRVPLAIVMLAAIMSVAAGCRYLLSAEFMPYHAVVAGKSWAQFEPGVQTIILGMLKILGGGFLGCGIALLWLLVPLNRGEVWAQWAALSGALAVWVPTQYVTLVLKAAAPGAEPPIVPTAVVLALVIVGVGCMFVPRFSVRHEPA